MNYADEDEVTAKYVEDCEAQDSEQLRHRYLIAEAKEHLLAAARLADLAAERLSPVTGQADRRQRLQTLAATLRDERDFIGYRD
jgi:hypothetical protein